MIIPELSIGGAQRSFSQLSHDLAARHDIHVVIFNRDHLIGYQVSGEFHCLNVIRGDNSFDKFFKFILRVVRLRKLKKGLKPDVSISFLEGADYVNLLAPCNDKIIVSIRGSKNSDREIKGWLGWLRKKVFMPWLYKRAAHVVSVSEFLEKEMIESYRVKKSHISTIHNYYDFEIMRRKSIEAIPSKFEPWITGPAFINVGRLHPQKNQQFLISTFASILQIRRDAKLVIIGDGSIRKQLVNSARSSGIKTYTVWDDVFSDDFSIYFLGEQANPFPFLKRGLAFLLPSLYEGFPNVLIEAMFCGLPVFSSDCEFGPREILNPSQKGNSSKLSVVFGQYGILLPSTEQDTPVTRQLWVETIRTFLDTDELQREYSLRGVECVRRFSKENNLLKWYQLIEHES